MQEPGRAAGKTAVMERLAPDYPQGPHRQPRSMCPAFGSLRVGLRMRRTATILCGSACCVYGLTFTSHFLRRPPHGRLRAVQLGNPRPRPAVRGHPRRGVRDRPPRWITTRSSSSTSACPPPRGVPTRPATEADRRRPDHRHRRARLRRPDPRRGQRCAGRRDVALCPARGRAGACRRGRRQAATLPTRRICSPGFFRPIRRASARCWRRWRSPLRRPRRPASGGTSTARWIAPSPPQCIHSTPPACGKCGPPAAPWSGPGPVGVEGTAAWHDAVGHAAGVAASSVDEAKARSLPGIRAALTANPISARITVSGYEGSELLVARLLIEAGAEVPYVGTACLAHRMERSGPRLA